MHNNRYLIISCIFLIILMGYIRTVDISGLNNTANSYSDYMGEIGEYEKYVMDENILMDNNDVKVDEKKIEKKIEYTQKPKEDISVESYLIGNLETGEIYMSKNVNTVYPIASLTKLFTAIIVENKFGENRNIKITDLALEAYGDAGKLVLNEEYKIKELLYPLLLESSNDAAHAYALEYGFDEFISEMNSWANEMKMKNTKFRDSSGLSPKNISNANDLFILAQYMYKNEKDILDITKVKEIKFDKNDLKQEHYYKNINPYSNYSGFIGGKTGRTEWAKESMVSLFNHILYGVNFPIAIIILRSDIGEREINTEKLLGKFIDMIEVK